MAQLCRTINDIEPEHEALVGKLFSAAKVIAAKEGLSERGYRVVMPSYRSTDAPIETLSANTLPPALAQCGRRCPR